MSELGPPMDSRLQGPQSKSPPSSVSSAHAQPTRHERIIEYLTSSIRETDGSGGQKQEKADVRCLSRW